MSDFNQSPTPLYSHLIRGWGGFANVMEAMNRDNYAMSPHLLEEFKALVARLQAVIDVQERLSR